jgi:hypothetical protein
MRTDGDHDRREAAALTANRRAPADAVTAVESKSTAVLLNAVRVCWMRGSEAG